MAGFTSLPTAGAEEYGIIESALMETARGRWFLAEFARRNRGDDTERLLTAIGRIESLITAERPAPEMDRMRVDLVEMVKAISRTKVEIAAIQAPDHDQSRLEAASEALDAIVRATERATSDILEAAEEVQEVAWTLREGGADPRVCDALDHKATQIYTACSFQDLTAQRTSRIVNTLRYLEQRLTAMIEIWGAEEDAVAPAPEPVPARVDLAQSDVDAMIATAVLPSIPAAPPRRILADTALVGDDLAFVPSPPVGDDLAFVPSPPPTALRPVAPPQDDEPEVRDSAPASLSDVFADIDALAVRERLLRFS
ncbi:hypothetical protein [Methylobacterium sp. ID0610]|uniref:hypothetical protein n=1 Tax=Methylobacterium carpenticola TaxID=3344827 RepID=UPI00369161A0